MPRSSAPRKKYKPKGTLKDPLSYVLGGIRPASEEAKVKRKIVIHSAMQALTQGTDVRTDWEKVAAAVNVGLC